MQGYILTCEYTVSISVPSGQWPSGQIKTLRVAQGILNGKTGPEAIFPPSTGITDHQAVDHYCHVGWKFKPVFRESMTCFPFPSVWS